MSDPLGINNANVHNIVNDIGKHLHGKYNVVDVMAAFSFMYSTISKNMGLSDDVILKNIENCLEVINQEESS